MEEKTSFLIKEIPQNLWDKFKREVPRTTTLNDAMIELIRNFVMNANKDRQTEQNGKSTNP